MEKIKTALEYFKEACSNFEQSKQIYDEPFFVEIIKQAQIDMAKLVTERCSKEAKIKTIFKSTGDYSGYDKNIIDEQSILNVFEQIKGEIENDN